MHMLQRLSKLIEPIKLLFNSTRTCTIAKGCLKSFSEIFIIGKQTQQNPRQTWILKGAIRLTQNSQNTHIYCLI